VPEAYGSVERVLGADETGVAIPVSVAWDAAGKRLVIVDGRRPTAAVGLSTGGAPSGRLTAAAARALAKPSRDAAQSIDAGSTGVDRATVALDPASGHRFAWAADTRTIWEFDANGRALSRRALPDADLHDVTAMTVAPSADTTDAPSEMALYVADAGLADGSGAKVVELAIVAPLVDAVAIEAAASSVQLVNTINTGSGSTWTPDSPDPSGLAYIPAGAADVPAARQDRLVSADGEVEETSGAGWHNVNVWFAPRNGAAQTSTMDTTVSPTSPRNTEPVGAAYDAVRKELYLAKDGSAGRIWVYNMATGLQARTFDVAGAPYGNADVEGLGFDSATNTLYMVDAIDNDLVKVVGGSGIIGSGSSVQVFNYDLEQYGQTEPEGLDVDPATGNIWVVSNRVTGSGIPDPMLELTSTGGLVSSVSIAAANPDSAGGVAIAPASNGSGATAIYVADRGVDNNDQASENDGKIYEFAAGGATGLAPVANFTWTQGSGMTVAFDDTSTNQPTSWVWDFGDPNSTADTSTEPSPSYTYPAPGTYQVTLTATNDIGFDSDTQTVTVSSGPPPGSGNLMTNGSFELANASNQPSNWTTNAGFSRSTAVPPQDGSFVGRHTGTGNVTYTVYSDAPIVGGRTYTLSGWYQAPTTADAFNFIAKIKWRGPGGNLTTVVVKKFSDDTGGTWVQFSGSVVAPATATTARVMMTAKSMAGTFYVDGLVLQEAP
jgi:PKD repeat protein